MRVLLRDKETKLFYGGCGQWVERPDRALIYQDFEQVHNLVAAERNKFEVVLSDPRLMQGARPTVSAAA